MLSQPPTATSPNRRSRGYAAALSVLFGLFVLRVLAQALIAIGYGRFLPPWEEWFSGLVPYPQLLASQAVIVLVYGKVCADFIRDRGFFVTPRRWMGTPVVNVGIVYLAVMVIRYIIRMSLYPPERWTGGAIPIVFHWVLASFILVFGAWHRNAFPPPRRTRAARMVRIAAWLAVAAGILGWMAYQTAPTILATVLGTRAAEQAVRIDRSVAIASPVTSAKNA